MYKWVTGKLMLDNSVDKLAWHPGRVQILLVASSYGNQKLSADLIWSVGSRASFITLILCLPE